jgi:hypothetical protein
VTKKETISLFGILIAAYPNFDKFKDDSQVEGMVNMWASLFADDDSTIVGLAVKKHIMTSKWPPSIAEIRDIMADITHPDLIPPDQAWAAVSDLLYAVGESNSNAAHRQLPPLIAQTVDAIGWRTLYQLYRGSYGGSKDGMDRVAFMDLYRPAYERARTEACCSPTLTGCIEAARRKLSTGGIAQLEAAKTRRTEKEREYDRLWHQSLAALDNPGARPALTSGEEETT